MDSQFDLNVISLVQGVLCPLGADLFLAGVHEFPIVLVGSRLLLGGHSEQGLMGRIRLDQVRFRVPFPGAHPAAFEREAQEFLAFTELLLGAAATQQVGGVGGKDIR
jgi:hypothetical protein